MHRQIAVLSTALVFTVVATYFYQRHLFLMSVNTYYVIAIVYWLSHFLVLIIIRTGFNKTFADPSLTMFQIIWSTIFIFILVYFLIKWRSLLLMAYFAVFGFGYFQFRFREFLSIGVFAILSYTIVILLLFIEDRKDFILQQALLQLLTFSCTIMMMTYIGSAIHRLRKRTKKQTIKLEAALALNKKLATTDELTGLYNRRYFMRIFSQQKSLSLRDNKDFAICYCDMDHFKQINDAYGHHNGDIVLKKFANILTDSVRDIDLVARLGGEEFVCLLVNTEIKDAIKVATRIRDTLANYNFSDIAPTLKATVSIGIATFKEFNSIQQTLMVADDRLYRAKQLGRNRVIYTEEVKEK